MGTPATARSGKPPTLDDAAQPGGPLVAQWLVRTLWVSLAVVVLLLFALAVVLLVKSHVLSARSLTDEQTKSLWAFLGVAFGAVVTLIGALLTEQHNRRTDALTRQTADREQAAREQEQRLADETEYRLKIDTTAKVLELITVEGGDGYAPRARVAGAIATLMQLGGGVIGMRILGELWAADAIDSDTACWLIDRILQDSSAPAEEVVQAANLLAVQAQRLVLQPEDSSLYGMFWPDSIADSWPVRLPDKAKDGILVAIIRLLLARDIEWWKHLAGAIIPIDLLIDALRDTGCYSAGDSARVLSVLSDAGAFDKLQYPMDRYMEQIRELSSPVEFTPWLDNLLKQLNQWAAGQPYSVPVATTNTPTVRPLST
jgi:hypothetical protein